LHRFLVLAEGRAALGQRYRVLELVEADRHGELPAAVGVALVVAHRPQGGRLVAGVLPAVLRRERGGHERHALDVAAPATLTSAAAKGAGKSRPRFSARRKIPEHALGLKENLGGTRGSKIADKEHPTAPLGDSEPPRVQHSPPHAVPCVSQGSEDDGEVPAPVAAEEARDVFQQKPARA
jgi:hypothetical protein